MRGAIVLLTLGLFAGLTPAAAQLKNDCSSGIPAKAISACSALISAKGSTLEDRVNALVFRADAFVQENRFDEALADLRRVFATTDKHPLAYHVRGRLYASQNEWAKALPDLNKAIAAMPNFAPSRYMRGYVLSGLGRYEAAKIEFDTTLGLEPTHWPSLWQRGVVFRVLGKLDEALADLDRAAMLNPGFAMIYVARGVARESKGDLKGAHSDYKKALELAPGEPTAEQRIAAVTLLLQRAAATTNDSTKPAEPAKAGEAVPQKPGAPERPGEGAALLEEARKALADKNYRGVFKAMVRYMEFNTTTAEAYLLRGQAANREALIQSDMKLFLAARDDLDRAIQLAPQSFPAVYERGYVNSHLGDLQRAKEDADRAIQLQPNSALAYILRSTINFSLGKYDDAFTDADTVVTLEPRASRGYLDRASASIHRKAIDSALADVEKALELEPRSARAYVIRGNALLAKGNSKEAEAAFTRALTLNGTYEPAKRGLELVLAQRTMARLTGGAPQRPVTAGGAKPKSAEAPAGGKPIGDLTKDVGGDD